MEFKIIGRLTKMETMAVGNEIRNIEIINKAYGRCPGRWRKRKGWATIELENGRRRYAELHWYECHGKGRFGMKIKTRLENR